MRVRRLLGWPDPGQVALSALIGILLAFYAARFLLPLLAPQPPRADDFQDYLFAAQQIATGGDPYANFIRNHVPWDWSLSSGYLYPPAFAVTLIPLTWVSNDLAVRIWLFLIQAAVLTSLDHTIYYFREMLPHLAAGTGYRENQSLAGFTARICQPSSADAGGGAGWCGRVLDWPLIVGLLVIVLRATSRASRTGLEFAL